jgi:hypothetical protein
MRMFLLSFSLLVIASCSSNYHFSQSTFVESRFELNSYKFSIYHPPYLISEFPRTESIHSFQISDNQGEDYNSLMTNYYDYFGGAFDGVYGTFQLSVRVNKWHRGNAKGDINLFTLYSKHLDKIKARKIKSIKLNSVNWYQYQSTNVTNNSLYWVTPLNEDYYLQVIFHFIDNDRGHNSGWYNDAVLTSNKIVKSMVLHNEI